MGYVKPTRVWRSASASLAGLAVTALRKDLPIPVRMLAVEVLKINIDQLASKENAADDILKYADAVVDFMKSEGYDIPKPSRKSSAKPRLGGDSSREAVEWIREVCRRGEGEPIATYIDRVSLFLTRVLAIFTTIAFGEEEGVEGGEEAREGDWWETPFQ